MKKILDEKDLIKNIKDNNFCILPFIQISSRAGGLIAPCCRSDALGNFYENSFLSAWNNSGYKKIRKKLLKGEKPKECKNCWEMEKNKAFSYRFLNIKKGMHKTFLKQLDLIKADYSMPKQIKILDIGYSGLCNLKCRMCECSTKKDKRNNTKKTREVLQKNLSQLSPYLSIVRLTGGEPFINPNHELILENLLPYAHNISLEYSTNLSFDLSKFNSILDKWKKFKEVSIIFSLDGTKNINNYIRIGVEYEKILNNIDICLKHSKVNKVICSFTFQALNSYDFPYFLKYISRKQPKIILHGNILKNPDFLDVAILPLKKKRELIKNYKILKKEIINDKININRKKNYIMVINHFIEYLNLSSSRKDLLKTFIKYNKKIDKKYNITGGLKRNFPELKDIEECIKNKK
jgi:organic radical activating enzyme